MANDPTFYEVTMNNMFVLNDVVFRPPFQDGVKQGFPRYTVPAAVYNGTLSDGTTLFADMCATANPIYDTLAP